MHWIQLYVTSQANEISPGELISTPRRQSRIHCCAQKLAALVDL